MSDQITIDLKEYEDLKADAERYRKSLQAHTSTKDVKEFNYKVQGPKGQDFGYD